MPTGYTAAIKDGITFEQYALDCARAFGACVTMRDDPSGTPIPERFEPIDYHVNARKKSEAQLAELEAMTDDECTAKAFEDYEQKVESHRNAIENARELAAKYAAMLAQVDAWTPPSAEHEELKIFMRAQITSSIPFDCDISYYQRNNPKMESGIDWRAKRLSRIVEDIGYHKNSYSEEVARTNSRNEWVRLLRESLEPRA